MTTTQETNKFVNRYLTFIIGLGTGQMGDGEPGKYYTLENYRAQVHIAAYGGETQGEATVRIFGVGDSLINKLTTIGPIQWQVRAKNSIQILAGDDPKALTTIYNGTIQTAYADLNNSPDVSLEITAISASVAALQPATPTTYNKDSVKVVDIMRYFANKLGWQFENVDVDAVLSYPTFNGSYLDQIKSCAYAADIDYATDNFTLSIKKRMSHFGNTPVVISPLTNMVGYPTLSSNGLLVKSLFLPLIRQGGQIEVKDSIQLAANGKWTVNMVEHNLDSLVPNGNWFTSCGAFADGLS